jgi:protein-S-isoprenylcysteine O-methyltransferase Ste14
MPRAPGPPAVAAIAWGGALVFVLSLAFFLYSYLVRFAIVPNTGPVAEPVVIDVVLFSIFALHHSLFARTALKSRVRAVVPPSLERSLYTWIASLLFIAACWGWQPIPGIVYRLSGVSWWIGVGVQAAGFAFVVVSSRAIDVLDLAGVRQVLRARSGEGDAHVPLETHGVYGIVRHPLYFGWTLFVCGTEVMTVTRAVFALVSCAYLALAVPWEERGLVDAFGPAYEGYRAKVRWRMLPGIY